MRNSNDNNKNTFSDKSNDELKYRSGENIVAMDKDVKE